MLVGRDAERAALHELVAEAGGSRSGALVIRGDPGIGKSALLADAISGARGMRVLQGVGIESEAELAFGALHQVLRPVLDWTERLPAPQAVALRGAFGLSSERVGDRFLISVGVLSLLAEAAEDHGLVCVVNDAHWLDGPSAEALVFCARRLGAEGVAMIFAAREGDRREFAAPGLRELRLAGLDPEEAAALLAAAAGEGLAPAVRDDLFSATGGNPLALLELSEALSEPQLEGHEPIPDPLPLSRGLEEALLRRVRRLPPETQRVLLVAAAEDEGQTAAVLAAASALGLDPRALGPAETAGLIAVNARISFSHPLVRSAIYRSATFADRCGAHQALAVVMDGERGADRRAWHRAAAASGPDEGAAAELERYAGRARIRSGHAAAAAALERSAELSPEVDASARRLAAAADEAFLAGRFEHALALAERAVAQSPTPRIRAEAAYVRGSIELLRGTPQAAHTLLTDAAEGLAPFDLPRALALAVAGARMGSMGGELERAVESASRLAGRLEGGPTDVERFLTAYLRGLGGLWDEGGARGRAGDDLREGLRLAQAFDDPLMLVYAGDMAAYLDDAPRVLALYERAAAAARERGAVADVPIALWGAALASARFGRVAAAEMGASEGLELARATGQVNIEAGHRGILARVAAFRGREEECRSHAAAALEHSLAHGLSLFAGTAAIALAELELGAGRTAAALDHLEALAGAGNHFGVRVAVVPDLVEAAVRAGRPERARAPLEAFGAWASRTSSPRTAALLSRCRGLMAKGAAATRALESALRLGAGLQMPVDQARNELAMGEHLRRAGRRTDARRHLRAALDTFEALGAALWAERARSELRASGESTRPRDRTALRRLTPRERQIALLVAEGATNKDAAAQLFLSTKTVEYHLHKVFDKLAISSRAELIRSGVRPGR